MNTFGLHVNSGLTTINAGQDKVHLSHRHCCLNLIHFICTSAGTSELSLEFSLLCVSPKLSTALSGTVLACDLMSSS